MIHLEGKDRKVKDAIHWLLQEMDMTTQGDLLLRVRMHKGEVVRIERTRECVEVYKVGEK